MQQVQSGLKQGWVSIRLKHLGSLAIIVQMCLTNVTLLVCMHVARRLFFPIRCPSPSE